MENTRLKHFNDFKSFIDYSNDMNDIHKNIQEYNPNKKRKIVLLMIWLLICLITKKVISQ